MDTPEGQVPEEAVQPAEPLQEEEIEQSQGETEVEEVEEVDTPEADGQDEEQPEEPKPSRRESLRIQQLIQKMRQSEEPKKPEAPKGLDYTTALEADADTISQLEQDRRQYGEQQYRQGLEQAKAIQFTTRLEIDAPRVESKYPALDKDSPEFKPAVADAINNWYLATAGYNPETGTVQNADVRYADFVDGIMELGNEIAGEKNLKTVKNVVKQAAATGLRPDGSRAKMNLNKAPENMTDDELKAVISQAIK